jgi:hypothetical protein
MRNALLLLLLMLGCNLHGADREPALARDMAEDAILRNDVQGMDLARGRLLRLAAESADRTVQRDAYYLAALTSMFDSYSGEHDAAANARIVASGSRYAARVLELDPQFADGWLVAGLLGGRTPESRARIAKAVELDPKSPAVAFFSALFRSMNPLGGAPPEGVKMFDDLAARLDADRAATGRRFGLWDAQAHAWSIYTRIAQDEPNAPPMRAMAAKLVAERPDFDLGQQLAGFVAERRFVAAPAVTWQPFLTDAANDGKSPQHPDVLSVDRAENGDRLWYRVTFREPLPRSFGVNLVVNRSGDPATGMKWWGNGSNFHFDRLVTAYITRDGDRYFGRVGLTDDDGARGAKIIKFPIDIQLAMSDDQRSVMLGVPKTALELTDSSTMIVAGGTHLVWNDDATSAPNSR